MSIRGRGILSFGFIFITLIFVGFIQNNNASAQKEYLEEIQSNTIKTAFLAESTKLSIVQVQQYLTDISATRAQDGLDDGFELAEQYSNIFYENITKLKQLNPEDEKRLSEIETTFTTYYETGKQMAQSYIEGGPEKGNKMMGDFDETSIAINELVDEFTSGSVAKTEENLTRIQELIDRNTKFFLIVYSLVIVIGIVVATLLSRSIINPLDKIINSTNAIASGDLGQSVLLNRKDELGKLSQSFDAMRMELSGLIQKIHSVAEEVSETSSTLKASAEESVHSADEISQTMQHIAASTQSQADDVANSTHYIQEVSQGMNSAAKAIQTVTDLGTYAKETAQNGNNVVRQTLEQMEVIRNTVQHAFAVVVHLDEKSKEINQIISIITGIADQTNLLALNAAIESARAGEHGKGFAVVADEVRKLAEQSAMSANDIHILISEIQTETENAVQSMEGGMKAVEDGGSLASKTGIEFENITHIIEDISEQNYDISAVVEQVGASADDVVQTMQQIATISEDLAMRADQIASIVGAQYESSVELSTTVEDLNEMATDLEGFVKEFKL